MNRLRNLSIVLISGLVLAILSLGLPARSYALFNGARNQACAGVSLGSSTTCTDTSKSLSNKVGTAIDLLSIVVGIIAVIFIIVGGLKFITAGGDPSSIASARNSILYSLVGLVVVALSQVVVKYVLFRVTK